MSLLQIKGKINTPFAKGLFDTVVGSGLSKLILVIATFVFARLLTKNDFGTFSFVRNTLNMILCICALNYTELVTKYTTELATSESAFHKLFILSVFSIIICISIGAVIVLIPKDKVISLLGNQEGGSYIKWIGFFLPIFMLQPIAEGVLRGRMQFKLIGKLQIVSALIFVGIIVVGIKFAGVRGAIYGLIVYYICYAIVSVIAIIRTQKLKVSIFKRVAGWQKELSVLPRMVLPVFFLSFIEAPVNWWAQAIMAKFDNVGSIASMTAILQIRNLAMLIPAYYFNTFSSFAAKANAEGDFSSYFGRFKQSLLIITPIVLAFVMVLCIMNQPILGLYGNDYKGDKEAFYIAMCALPLLVVANLLKINLLIREHQKLMIIISLFSSAALIIVLYYCLNVGCNSVKAYFWAQFAQIISMLPLLVGQFIYEIKTSCK